MGPGSERHHLYGRCDEQEFGELKVKNKVFFKMWAFFTDDFFKNLTYFYFCQIRQYEWYVPGSKNKIKINVALTTYEILLKDKVRDFLIF